MHKRVVFKTVVLVWKCVNGTAPVYLSELCVPVASASVRQHLRSASTGLLQVPRARTTIGRRSFAVAGPSLWNSLSAALRRPEMTAHFQKETTESLSVPDLMCWRTEVTFTTARSCCDVCVILAPDIKLQTYLLTYYRVGHFSGKIQSKCASTVMRHTPCPEKKRPKCFL